MPPMLVGVDVLPVVVAEFGGGEPVSDFIAQDLPPIAAPSGITGMECDGPPCTVASTSKYDSSWSLPNVAF